MRIMAPVLMLLAGPLAAQEKSQWQRVYTYEDAVIEMEVIRLSFGNFGRVRFRTVFDEPGPLGRLRGIRYKSSVEEMEFHCAERGYRITEMVLLDAEGKVIQSFKAGGSQEWKVAESGSMMGRLTDAACRMIAEKRL